MCQLKYTVAIKVHLVRVFMNKNSIPHSLTYNLFSRNRISLVLSKMCQLPVQEPPILMPMQLLSCEMYYKVIQFSSDQGDTDHSRFVKCMSTHLCWGFAWKLLAFVLHDPKVVSPFSCACRHTNETFDMTINLGSKQYMSLESVEEGNHTIWKPMHTQLDLLWVKSFCWKCIWEVKPICQQFAATSSKSYSQWWFQSHVVVMLGILICI
jgi:hypothetical protein